MRDLHDRNPRYFEKIVYNKSSGRYVVDRENFAEEHQFQHYGDVVSGFMKHLSLLKAPDSINKYTQDFEAALRNPTLTRQLFAEYLSAIRPAIISADIGRGVTDGPSEANSTAFVFRPSFSERSPGGEINEVVLNNSMKAFTISVPMRAGNSYRDYRATVIQDNGEERLARMVTSHEDMVTVTLDSTQFITRQYGLRIEGQTHDGRSERVAVVFFRVIKK